MSELRLKWRKTWPDRPDDFTARDGAFSCRMYRHNSGGEHASQYYWVANRERALGSGYASTPREAASAAEACFFAAGEKTVPPVSGT